MSFSILHFEPCTLFALMAELTGIKTQKKTC